VLAACAIAAACGGHTDVRLEATPRDGLIDAPLNVRATGVEGEATLTVRAPDWQGRPWTATAPYKDGDVAHLLSNMLPAGAHRDARYLSFGFVAPTHYRLTLRQKGRVVAGAEVVRRPARNGVGLKTEALRRMGLVGYFCSGPPARVRRPAVLSLGGSEGGLPSTLECGLLASHGYPTLTLAYFGLRRLPPGLENVRLEYLARALRWLARQPGVDPRKVVVNGYSRGGELALILGAVYPQLVHGVIAYVPSSVVNPGLVGTGPAWTLHGRELPFLEIPVERIRGPVLLVGAGADEVWPSGISVTTLADRLRRNGHTNVTTLRYPRAGHAVAAAVPNLRNATIVESPNGTIFLGGSPDADARARVASWAQLLAFLRRLG
jgi:dienelactone hydrolase